MRLVRATPYHEPLIVDVGCGPGRDSALLRLAGARPLRLDLSREMLRVAAELERGPLLQADMRRRPLGARSADAIWCFAALGHLPPAAGVGALREFARILDRGWLYVVVRQGAGPRVMAEDGPEPRFLTDFSLEGLEASLRTVGFRVHERHAWPSADGRRWLHVIARLPG